MEPSARPAPGCAMWIRLSAGLPEAREPTSSSEVGAPLADADKRIVAEINDDTTMPKLSQARGLNLEGQRTRAKGRGPSLLIPWHALALRTLPRKSRQGCIERRRGAESEERTECAKELDKQCSGAAEAAG